MRGPADRPAPIKVHDKLLEAGFVQVPVLLLRTPRLRPGAKLLYASILWYQYHLGYWPGRTAVSVELDISPRSISSYLAELEEHGLIRIQRGEYDVIEGIEVFPPRPLQNLQRTGEVVEQEPLQDLQRESAEPLQDLHPARDNRICNDPRRHVLHGLAKGLWEQGREIREIKQVLRAYGADEVQIEEVLKEIESAQKDR